MDPPEPGVTVLVPAFNAMPHLRACVESVLAQSVRNLELLVIDDGSTDGTRAYLDQLADPRIRAIHKPNEGLVATLNLGLRSAKFDWIARLDADDVMQNDRLAKQLSFLDANPEFRVVASENGYIDAGGRVLRLRKHLHLSNPPEFDPMVDGNIPHQAVLYHRADVLSVQGYRELVPAEDLDLWLRLRGRVRFGVIPEPLTYVRILAGSITDSQYLDQRMMWRYVMECARARAAGTSEPEYRSWLTENQRVLIAKRRSWMAGRHLRQAGIALAARRPFSALRHMVLALWFGPSEVLGKLRSYRATGAGG